MAKEQEIKVYNLEDLKDKKKIKGLNPSVSRVEEHAANIVEHHIDGISDEAYKILHTNPFLYNPKHQELKITSVEDYFIDVKKTSLPLGQVMRGGEFSTGKKKKFVKLAFKNWKKTFEESKDKTIRFEQEKNQLIGGYINNSIGFKHYLLVSLVLLFVSIISFKPGLMWTRLYGSKWFGYISNAITFANSISWFKLVTTTIIYLSIISLLYINLYNAIILDLKKMDNLRQKVYLQSNLLMSKEFKKKFNTTSKYYIRKARKKNLNFSPLPIEKTAIRKVDLKLIEEMTDGFIKKAMRIKKNKFVLNFLKYIFVYLLYLGGIAVFGYIIYLIVINIF